MMKMPEVAPHDEHTDHATDKGSDKAEDDGGGSIGEEDGAVDGGDGTGDQLVGDARKAGTSRQGSYERRYRRW